YESNRARRPRRGRFRRRHPVLAGLWLLRQASRNRLGSGSHRASVGGTDEAPRLHPLRRARRRLGAPVSSAMARRAAAGLLGIHINLPATVPPEVAAALGGGPVPPGLSEKERAVLEALMANAKSGNSAYFTMMTARPQTVGYGATDSPAGLAAWILVH